MRTRMSVETSWDELEVYDTPSGGRFRHFTVGEPEVTGGPTVIRVTFPPGTRVEAHTHACDYCEVLLEGSEVIGRRLHRAGDIVIRSAGTVYGPLVAGPDGVTKLLIFADDRVQALRPNQPLPADEATLRIAHVIKEWATVRAAGEGSAPDQRPSG